jgi:acetylornithine/succinyldiaminopimelate/putrescine aminotransferase
MDSPDTAKTVVAKLLEQGILINRTQDTVLRFLPPYIIAHTHVDQVVRALDAALAGANSRTNSKGKLQPVPASQATRRRQSR